MHYWSVSICKRLNKDIILKQNIIEDDDMRDFTDISTIIASIATLITPLIVLFTLLEMKKQRKSALQPDVVVRNPAKNIRFWWGVIIYQSTISKLLMRILRKNQ